MSGCRYISGIGQAKGATPGYEPGAIPLPQAGSLRGPVRAPGDRLLNWPRGCQPREPFVRLELAARFVFEQFGAA